VPICAVVGSSPIANLSVPPREVSRQERAYRAGAWRNHPFQPPDLIVLSIAELGRGLAPGPSFERTYVNPGFEVWVRR
jgi:hypothetical protein